LERISTKAVGRKAIIFFLMGMMLFFDSVIFIEDTNSPVLNSPDDIICESIGHNISWIAEDNQADIYVIYRNGTEIVSGTWCSGVPITISLNGLLAGLYYYIVIVYDASGNFASDMVIVTILL